MAKNLEALKELKDVYWKEVQELSKVKGLNNAMVDYIDKVTHTLKSICTIIAMEEGRSHDDHHDEHDDEAEEHQDQDDHDEESRVDKYEKLLKEFAGKIQKV